MSAFDDLLDEEYERSQRMLAVMEQELALLPKGYLSCKKIAGSQYYYLQERDHGKIISKYVKKEDVDALQKLIERRRSLQTSIRSCKQNIKKIERARGNGKNKV